MKGLKTGGREQGTPNKLTSDLREQIEAILSSKFTSVQIEQDIATLEPKDRLTVYMKLLEYSIPKMRSTELTGAGETPLIKNVIKWGDKEIEI